MQRGAMRTNPLPGWRPMRTFSSGFDPRSLFSAGEQGGWWDPSDFSTMFQDSAGTTPVTATGQPVGLILDKRLGAARGAEALTNGNFANGTTGWTNGAALTPTVVGGVLQLARNGAVTTSAAFRQTFSVTAGVTYELTCTAVANANAAIRVDSTTQVLTARSFPVGSTRITFVPDGSTATVNLWAENDLTTTYLANFSIRPVPGNHRTQSTAASRPTLQQDASGYWYLSYDVDDFMQTASVDFTGTDKVTLWTGLNKASDATRAIYLELGVATNNAFSLNAPNANAAGNISYTSGGSLGVGISNSTVSVAAPVSAVVTGMSDIAGDSVVLRYNGVAQAAGVADQGTGNYRNDVLYFGRRGNATLPFNGREYQTIIRGAASTATQIAQAERFCGSRMGISL